MKRLFVLGAVAAFAVMASVSPAQAEIGVGVKWAGGGIAPNFVLPIKTASGLVLEPSLGFTSISTDTPESSTASVNGGLEGTVIRFGLAVEKYMETNSVSPFFGAAAHVNLSSPDAEGLDSYTDFSFGVFVGGAGHLSDHVELVGYWGPMVTLVGEQKAGENVLQNSQTVIQSKAHLGVRFWLWGNE